VYYVSLFIPLLELLELVAVSPQSHTLKNFTSVDCLNTGEGDLK